MLLFFNECEFFWLLSVQDKISKDDFLGGFMVDLAEVPVRKPPEQPLKAEWYKLEAKGRGTVSGTWSNFQCLNLVLFWDYTDYPN